MPTPSQTTLLRRIFSDICRGYSLVIYRGTPLYIRHLGHREQLELEDLQALYQDEAVTKGAYTEPKRLAYLVANKIWSLDKEDEIAKQRDTLIRFEDGKKHLVLPSMIVIHDKQIENERGKLHKLLTERAAAMGMTAEIYAQQRLNDYYIIHNLFRDKGLTTLYYTEESFEDFTDSAVEEIVDLYNGSIDSFSDKHLRQLSVQDFFVNYYVLCGDSLNEFFGKPVVEMSFHQIRLANWARYFKSLMENGDSGKIPRDQRSDPDAIERMMVAQKNLQPMAQEGKVPMNMTKDDIKQLGLEGKMTPLPQKPMNFAQLIQHAQQHSRG